MEQASLRHRSPRVHMIGAHSRTVQVLAKRYGVSPRRLAQDYFLKLKQWRI